MHPAGRASAIAPTYPGFWLSSWRTLTNTDLDTLAIMFSKRMHSKVKKSDFGTQFGAEENGDLSLYVFLHNLYLLHQHRSASPSKRGGGEGQEETERGREGRTGQNRTRKVRLAATNIAFALSSFLLSGEFYPYALMSRYQRKDF